MTGYVERIDGRINGNIDRQKQEIPNNNRISAFDRRRKLNQPTRYARNGERFERTYRNLRQNTNQGKRIHSLVDTSFKSANHKTVAVSFEQNMHNCHDLQVRRNGIYKFGTQYEVGNEAGRFFYERYCDFNTDGGAWTVIQRRFINDQQENFNRSWMDYRLGFGELDAEFWFGNDFIHKLTSDEDVELRIILEDITGIELWAQYSTFKVDSEEYNYNLIIDGYKGTIPDGFLHHNDQEFSTYDRQNDNNDGISCATAYGSGWWFNE